ncbi:MAG: 3-oxoacid CoA-transferase subunit A [Tepidibacter sp.]|jgi:acetate CoA/acetoacetate CoA-transferase alpha subunit|uniref:CoA transferase subunit A n=1 Tax=Tepidibacter sp. TaxID=2529387 RepID=UPI0025F81CE4|nr:3-oxoacid CoA-transferase subunit A [Tepidibacter sp.]MCT4507891.1 3-oxoacid CoA-transferase subunit A [Tepidibacter sp.]
MSKVIDIKEAILKYVKPGCSVMFGGFLGCNTPLRAIDEIVNQNIGDLTVISTVNSFMDSDLGLLFNKKLVKKFIGSHIGTNPTVVKQYQSGEIDVEFFPQGTLIEKIRCKGAGLGGVLTPTGVGTLMEKGKQKLTLDDKDYLLETPLGTDITIIKGFKADKMGNIVYKGTPNANPIMAMAGNITIAEVEEIVEVGELKPTEIGTQGIFVDAICLGYDSNTYRNRTRDMCKRVGIYK